MAKSTVIDRDTGYKQALAEIKKLAGGDPHVTVGVHGKDSKPYKVDQGTPPTTAQIATFNEFGYGVPQRSFLRSTLDENQGKYGKMVVKGLIKIIDGEMSTGRLFGLIGARIVGDVQKKIASGIRPPNHPYTIAQKGSSKPLIDTGQLRQSIDWQTNS